MKKIVEYKIVINNPLQLVTTVNESLKEGRQPYGPVTIDTIEGNVFQAMVKYEE